MVKKVSKTIFEGKVKVDTEKATNELNTFNKAQKQVVKTGNVAKRAQEGVAKSSLSTAKAFSKQQQGLGGLVRAYATIAAHVFALTQVFQILRDAADFKSMQLAAEDMARVTGVNMIRLSKEIQRATGHNLDLRQSLESVNKTLAAGATPTQAKALANLAAKISQTFGGSVEANINKINSAVLRGRTELLATLGVVIDTQQVYRDYAAQLGKASGELTIFEKKQATINAIQEEGNRILGDVNLDRNPYLALLTTLTDVKDQITLAINEVGTFFAEIVNESERFAAALIATLGAVFARKLTPDAQAYAESASQALKKVGIETIRQQRAEIGLMIRAGDLAKKRRIKAIADSKKGLTSRLQALKASEDATKKFSATTNSLFKKIEKNGVNAFKGISTSTKKELSILQAQITKAINYKEKLKQGGDEEPAKPRGVASGILAQSEKSLRKTRDLIDEQLGSNRKLNREIKKLDVSTKSYMLTLRNLNAQRRVAMATGKRMAAQQKILTLRLVEQRGVMGAIIPSYVAVGRRVDRLAIKMGGASAVAKIFGRAMGYAATTTTLLAAAINKLFPILTALWLAYEIGTAIYRKFAKDQEEESEQVQKAREAYNEYKETLEEAGKALKDLSNLSKQVELGEKVQSDLNKFLVNFTDTLVSGLNRIIQPITSPVITPVLDTTLAEAQIELLQKKLDALDNQKFEVDVSINREAYGVEDQLAAAGEGSSEAADRRRAELEEEIRTLQEIVDNAKLKVTFTTNLEALISADVKLQAVYASLETIYNLQKGAELAKLNFDASPILETLKAASPELVGIVEQAKKEGADFEELLKRLGKAKLEVTNVEALEKAIELLETTQARFQSLSGSMATVNEQFIRSYGAAAKFSEEVTNMTLNPELTRATGVLIEQFENFRELLTFDLDRGALDEFFDELLKKDTKQLEALFGIPKRDLEALIATSKDADTVLAQLLKTLNSRQRDLFSSAQAKIFETQAKAAIQLGKSYQTLAKTASTINERYENLKVAQDELIKGADLQVASAEELVRAKEVQLKSLANEAESVKAVARAELTAARAELIAARANVEQTKRLQLVTKARLDYQKDIIDLASKEVAITKKIADIQKANTVSSSKKADASAASFSAEKRLLELQLDGLAVEKQRVKDLYEEEILQKEKLAVLEEEEKFINEQMEQLALRVALEQSILDIRKRGNRYNPLPGDLKQFGADLHRILEIEAFNFAKGMKTAAEEWAAVITKTTDDTIDAFVDDLIEGGVNIGEAIKASLRSSIGDIVKENLKGITRNILAGIFPAGKAAEALNSEQAIERLEDKLSTIGKEQLEKAKQQAIEQAKADGKTQEEINKAGTAAEAQAKAEAAAVKTAEGRDLLKIDHAKKQTSTLEKIRDCVCSIAESLGVTEETTTAETTTDITPVQSTIITENTKLLEQNKETASNISVAQSEIKQAIEVSTAAIDEQTQKQVDHYNFAKEKVATKIALLSDIKMLNQNQLDTLRTMVACACACQCSENGKMDFSKVESSANSMVEATQQAPGVDIKPVINLPESPPPSVVIPPPASPPEETVGDIVERNRGQIENPPEGDMAQRFNSRITELNQAQLDEAKVQTEIMLNGNKNSEDYMKFNRNENNPGGSGGQDKTFSAIFDTLAQTFFGPFGAIFSSFLGQGGGFDLSSIFSMFGGMADGGIVKNPSIVQVAEGGMAEAVVPLPNNREIPVKLEEEKQSPVVFNNTFDFTNADPATELRLRQMADQITRQSVGAVTQQINRGGSMAKRTGRR